MSTRRILAAIAGMIIVSAPAAAGYRPDPTELLKDLQMTSKTQERLTIVLWLPTEFWRASLEAGGKATPREVDRFVKELEPYVVVAVADGEEGIAGSVDFVDPEQLRNSVTVEDVRGNLLAALPDGQVSGGLRNLIQMMRPIATNMLGSLGSHVAIIVFPGRDKQGRPTVEAAKEGTFTVHVGPAAMRYRLPLGSLLPPAIDAKTGESFPGNYHFNPFTGDKLTPASPDADSHAPAAPAPGKPNGD